MGVEEEMLVVELGSGRPVPMAAAVLDRDPRADGASQETPVEGELMRQQVEMQTEPCTSLSELREALVSERRAVAKIAASQGLAVAPLGTSPFAVRPTTTPNARYERLVDRFGPIARQQLACGCHVHVSVSSRAEGVGVIDRIRPWLPLLLAISANSPYWQGADTGYASYRSQVWSRWPTAGPTEAFGSVEAYDATVQALIDSGGALDRAATYFDARLAVEHPTVEIRVADVCLDADDAVLVAGLSRALVDWAAEQSAQRQPVPPVRTELLRAATWRAARYGLTERLVDPGSSQPVPAADLLHRFVRLVRRALARHGDEEHVDQLIRELLARGTGSERQRRAIAASGRLADSVALAVSHTATVS